MRGAVEARDRSLFTCLVRNAAIVSTTCSTGAMASRDALSVDLLAAEVPPASGDVAQWAAEQSVFVSSLIRDMPDERAAARAAITSFGAQPVMFEDELGAQDVPADAAYLDGLARSSIYLGIYGRRYGVPLPSRYSATHEEFQHADVANLRMALFVADPFDDADGQQWDFVAGVRTRYTTASYAGSSQLQERIEKRLQTIAREELTPWVIVGETAFRATSIARNGSDITVRATVRNSRVAELLDSYADRRDTIPFASPHDSGSMHVTAVNTHTTSTNSRLVEMTLSASQSGANTSFMFASTNGVSAEDAFATSVQDALCHTGQPTPFGMTPLQDPLTVLRGAGLPDAVVRSLAKVLVSETLRENNIPGGASRFVLSPQRPEGRLIEVSWFPKKQYVNVPAPAERTVRGTIPAI